MNHRVRLRWRLARSHALLAIVLVAFAGYRISHDNELVRQAEATTVAVRDAEVLALRASRAIDRDAALHRLVDEEETPTRQAEVVSTGGEQIAGSALTATARGAAVAKLAISEGSPTYDVGRQVLAASPILAGSAGGGSSIIGAAVVGEAIGHGATGPFALGISSWFGVTIIVLAAVAGWLLAGRIARPIGALTDSVRHLALGEPGPVRSATTLPEVETLSAAVDSVVARDSRRSWIDDERRASLRVLSHRVSHQLRTPLSVLRLRLDDLADPAVDAERRAALAGVVAEQIDRLDRVGRELANLDPARWEMRRDPVDVDAVVTDVAIRNRPLASWGGVVLTSRAASGAMVTGDPDVIEDAIANLVQNAIKYTPRGGRVSTTTELDGDAVVVTVCDTGTGIPASQREHVVRPGVRGGNARAAEGSGHGLALVADAAERHGGHVELAETAGGGTTVRLVLPTGILGADVPCSPS